jgi:23S rRNA pseudouridine2605 synthase
MSQPQRLQKILSEAGIASRRKTEELIREGRVTINGRIAQIGEKADLGQDSIKVDGHRIFSKKAHTYLLLNKPKGFVTTTEDPEGRPVVLDLLKKEENRLFPVGRLDFDAEGFLLLTNDGELAHRLTHPSFHVPRKYWVKVKGKPTKEEIQKLSRRIYLEDGPTAPCQVSRLRETQGNLWVEMILYEGRNRQIKRMWQRLGYPVLKLERVGFAGLALGKLKVGEYRSLRPREIEKLKALVSQPERPGKETDRMGKRRRK